MNVMKKEINKVVSALKAHKNVVVSFEHLAPTVLVDSKDLYKAEYTDKAGSYLFEISKQGSEWVITSDGFQCSRSKDINYIKWNFESQLATYSPQVLI